MIMNHVIHCIRYTLIFQRIVMDEIYMIRILAGILHISRKMLLDLDKTRNNLAIFWHTYPYLAITDHDHTLAICSHQNFWGPMGPLEILAPAGGHACFAHLVFCFAQKLILEILYFVHRQAYMQAFDAQIGGTEKRTAMGDRVMHDVTLSL